MGLLLVLPVSKEFFVRTLWEFTEAIGAGANKRMLTFGWAGRHTTSADEAPLPKEGLHLLPLPSVCGRCR